MTYFSTVEKNDFGAKIKVDMMNRFLNTDYCFNAKIYMMISSAVRNVKFSKSRITLYFLKFTRIE